MNLKSSYLIILLILVIIYNSSFSLFISIPFKIIIIYNDINYNSTSFLYENFKKEIILELNIGTPPQKIYSKINQDSACFLFKKNAININNNKYFPNNSSSFSQNDVLKSFDPYKSAIDIFHFQQINKKNKVNFLLENYTNLTNDSYTPIIGLNIPLILLGNVCPNFIMDLKNVNIINKLEWSLIYNDKYDGEFIIGDELYEYNPNKYNKTKYSTLYMNSQYKINFDSVYIQDKQSNNNLVEVKFNITETHININSGFIIGTSEYKDYIEQNFFNKLINKKICRKDLITYYAQNDNNFNDIDKKMYNKNFYVYSCETLQFLGKTNPRIPSTNYYNEFPNLIFSSKMLEYNFEFSNSDLFKEILFKYYFLIIFKDDKNTKENEKEIWHLGEPFYKKYTFSINLDAKTIGFYIDKEINNNNKNNINNTNTNIIDEKNKNNINQRSDNEKNYDIIKYLIEIPIYHFISHLTNLILY